jgi:hypothetical protein
MENRIMNASASDGVMPKSAFTLAEPGQTKADAHTPGAGLTLQCGRQPSAEIQFGVATAEPGQTMGDAHTRAAGLTLSREEEIT